MEFIKVEKDCIASLAKLAKEIWHEYWGIILSDAQIEYMVENFQSENAIKTQLENEKYTYYFINSDKQNIGYFGIAPKGDYMFLSKLYIKKDFRGQGTGRKAFEEIKKITDKNGFRKIKLTVNKYNENTLKAYENWGFKTVDSVITSIGKGFVMDDYIMEYVIQDTIF